MCFWCFDPTLPVTNHYHYHYYYLSFVPEPHSLPSYRHPITLPSIPSPLLRPLSPSLSFLSFPRTPLVNDRNTSLKLQRYRALLARQPIKRRPSCDSTKSPFGRGSSRVHSVNLLFWQTWHTLGDNFVCSILSNVQGPSPRIEWRRVMSCLTTSIRHIHTLGSSRHFRSLASYAYR